MIIIPSESLYHQVYTLQLTARISHKIHSLNAQLIIRWSGFCASHCLLKIFLQYFFCSWENYFRALLVSKYRPFTFNRSFIIYISPLQTCQLSLIFYTLLNLPKFCISFMESHTLLCTLLSNLYSFYWPEVGISTFIIPSTF